MPTRRNSRENPGLAGMAPGRLLPHKFRAGTDEVRLACIRPDHPGPFLLPARE